MGRQAGRDLWAERQKPRRRCVSDAAVTRMKRDSRLPNPARSGHGFSCVRARAARRAWSRSVSEAVDPGGSGETSLAGGDDGADEVLLTVKERELLSRGCARTSARSSGSWPDVGWRSRRPLSVEVGWRGGRIDAVFERVMGGQSFLTGRAVSRGYVRRSRRSLFLRRSCARTGAWAAWARSLRRPARWSPGGPPHYTLESLEAFWRNNGREALELRRWRSAMSAGGSLGAPGYGPRLMPSESRPPQRRLMFSR